jgi:hypothetical protein
VSRGSSRGQGGSAAHQALAQQVGGWCAQHRGRLIYYVIDEDETMGRERLNWCVRERGVRVRERFRGGGRVYSGMSELARWEQSYDGSLLPRAWIGAKEDHVILPFPCCRFCTN